MENIFITILKMSLSVSIVAIVVMIARLCLRKAPKIFSYVLWLVVFFRLLCPISIAVPIKALPELPFSSYVNNMFTEESASHQNNSAYSPSSEAVIPSDKTLYNPSQPENITVGTYHENSVPVQTESIVQPENNMRIPAVLAYIWLAGTMLMLCYFAWSYASMSNKMNTAVRLAGNVFESDRIASAFVLGLLKPKIYIPTRLNDEQRHYIILHELTHIRRCDYLVKYIAFVALALHWFNPVVWLSYSLMCGDMEKSCDETVIRKLSDRGQPLRKIIKQYSMTLLSLAEGNGLAAPVSFADNSIKERMKNIMKYRKRRTISMICLAVVCALLMTACMSTLTAKDEIIIPSLQSSDARETNVINLTVGDKIIRSDVEELSLQARTVDINELSKCSRLKKLDLSGSNIENFQALFDVDTLEEIDLRHASIKDGDAFRMISVQEIAKLAENRNIRCLGIDCVIDGEHRAVSPNPEFINALQKFNDLQGLYLISSYSGNYDIIPEVDLTFLLNFSSISKLGIGCDTGDLSFLRQMPGLKELELRELPYGMTENITETLSGMIQLKSLSLIDIYDLEDLSFISGIKGLEKLTLWNLPVEDISSLSELNDMTDLSIIQCSNVKDISALNGMKKLEKLGLTECYQIADLSPIKKLVRLRELSLQCCVPSGDISALSTLSNLTFLQLSNNGISDISPLGNMSKIKELWLSYNSIEDIAPLATIPDLELLYLNNNNIKDISVISGMSHLRCLSVGTNKITDISPVANITSLESLSFGGNYVQNISALSGLSNITELSMSGNDIRDISVLSGLNKLRWLDISCDDSVDTKIIPVTELYSISLQGLGISDISALKNADKLERIEIINTNVNDLSSLYALQKLRYAHIYGEYVNQSDIDELARHLPDCNIEFALGVG